MINPFLPTALPTAPPLAAKRDKQQAAGEDFLAWLDPSLAMVATLPASEHEDRPERELVEMLLMQRDRQEPPVLGPQSSLHHVGVALPPATPVFPYSIPTPVSFETLAETLAEILALQPMADPRAVATLVVPEISTVTLPASVDTVLLRPGVGAAGERVDLAAVPWHLRANAGLSYRSADVTAPSPGADPLAKLPAVAANGSGRSETLARASVPMMASSERWSKSLQMLAVDSELHRTRQEDLPVGTADAIRPPAGWAPLLMWPQRLLRWLGDGEGTTAWVRDYQLELSKAESLIASLRCLAEQQGHPLRRIMLNGHELWRSPSSP